MNTMLSRLLLSSRHGLVILAISADMGHVADLFIA